MNIRKPNRDTPRSWLSLFVAHGGAYGIALLAGATLITFANMFGVPLANGVIWFGCAFGGLGLFWWGARMATDACFARASGRETLSYVFQVHQDHEHSSGWSALFPTGYFDWLHNDFGKCRTMTHPWSYVRRWQPGDEITIFEGRHRVWWEGDIGPRTHVASRIPKVSVHPAE